MLRLGRQQILRSRKLKWRHWCCRNHPRLPRWLVWHSLKVWQVMIFDLRFWIEAFKPFFFKQKKKSASAKSLTSHYVAFIEKRMRSPLWSRQKTWEDVSKVVRNALHYSWFTMYTMKLWCGEARYDFLYIGRTRLGQNDSGQFCKKHAVHRTSILSLCHIED